jgi:hypothetical protein
METEQMTNDRSHWRDAHDACILEAARYCDNDLALVLGERLEAALAALELLDDITKERDELDARCDIWKQQAIEAMDDLDALRGVK